jgi:hypothetical protein
VHSTNGPSAPIDLLLGDAYVGPAHDECDRPSVAQRVARAVGCEQLTRARMDDAMRAEREYLSYELNLTCTLVLGDAGAAAALTGLGDERCGEPEGALVFGCLLHLTGRPHGSRFWWKFAAGGDVQLAAYCLYLHHGQAAEFVEARYWREAAKSLGAQTKPSGRAAAHASLLPAHVFNRLLLECRLGRRPRLPLDIEAVVNQLLVECDADYGEITRPSAKLPSELAARS